MSTEENHFMVQRRKIHDAINEILREDPEYEKYSAVVKGWVLVLDISGFTPSDAEDVIEEVRGQPWADIDLWCSDATGETDLPLHTGEGLLSYAASHYEEIYDSRSSGQEEQEDDD